MRECRSAGTPPGVVVRGPAPGRDCRARRRRSARPRRGPRRRRAAQLPAGITKLAPSLVPEGQRVVTVLVLV
ncbi:hypothetical protein RK09_05685 [Kocuria rhizophila]|nr:hypothetical protein RK09_05685 [Kocuria rhizophila]